MAFGQKWQIIEAQIKAQEQSMQEQFESDLKELDTHVEEFVADYAKKNNISFILGKNKTGSLMYGNETNEVTDKVIKELNTAYGNKDDSSTSKTEQNPAVDLPIVEDAKS